MGRSSVEASERFLCECALCRRDREARASKAGQAEGVGVMGGEGGERKELTPAPAWCRHPDAAVHLVTAHEGRSVAHVEWCGQCGSFKDGDVWQGWSDAGLAERARIELHVWERFAASAIGGQRFVSDYPASTTIESDASIAAKYADAMLVEWKKRRDAR
jgi:hypothetical protein